MAESQTAAKTETNARRKDIPVQTDTGMIDKIFVRTESP
jgi:hypothetical protein